ncbi:MAG: hypothetical protein AB7P20_00240 [Rhizobiaceae bacterium]
MDTELPDQAARRLMAVMCLETFNRTDLAWACAIARNRRDTIFALNLIICEIGGEAAELANMAYMSMYWRRYRVDADWVIDQAIELAPHLEAGLSAIMDEISEADGEAAGSNGGRAGGWSHSG